MIVRLDPASALPPYEQLRQQIADMIAAGTLPAGRQLPPIRQLAADLDVAPGTVARAYRELESAGLVVSRGRRGTRVAERVTAERGHVDAELAAAAERFALTARQLGVAPDRALRAVESAFQMTDRPA